MAKRTGTAKAPKRVEALSHAATAARRNIPTAEYQALAERQEESDPVKPVRFPRRYRLQKGEERPRDKDADPQLVWNGVRIKLTPAQMKKLTEAGEVEIGEAQLVARQGPPGLVGPCGARAAALHPGEDPPQGDH